MWKGSLNLKYIHWSFTNDEEGSWTEIIIIFKQIVLSIDGSQTSTTTPGQSGAVSNGNEGTLQTPQKTISGTISFDAV